MPENAFFEQTVFDQDLSQGFLELARLSLELLDLVRGRLTRRVAGEPFLARLQELLRPTVVQVLIDPFLAAQLSNAVLATQAFQHDADLLFSGMMPACGSANIPDCLFSALRYVLARLSHRCSSAGYDEPAILSYAISSFCPTSADGLQGPTCQIDWLFARRGASSGVAPRLNHTADSASRIGGPHSITSSARAMTAGGTVRPSARAVTRLITRSNLVGCSTGRSGGLAPRRILST